jgi:hypothetical protein
MPKTPYTKITTAQLTTLASSTLGSLCPYQLQQVQEALDQINWGRANSNAGCGSQSDISNQPTITQIIAALGANQP